MSELTFVCYSRCSTCKKADKWLEANGVSVTVRDIKGDNPTAEELREWHKKEWIAPQTVFQYQRSQV